MSIIASDSGGGDFPKPKPGLHNAVCTAVFDLGDQPGFQGKIQHKIVIFWELEERIEGGEYDGERFVVSRMFTLSLNEKASLRAFLESWRGKAFTADELRGWDVERVDNVPCLVSVVLDEKDGRTYANVSAVMKHNNKYDVLTPELPPDWMPKWVKQKLDAPPVAQVDATSKTFEDDIPF